MVPRLKFQITDQDKQLKAAKLKCFPRCLFVTTFPHSIVLDQVLNTSHCWIRNIAIHLTYKIFNEIAFLTITEKYFQSAIYFS